jgi:hypothetical protein
MQEHSKFCLVVGPSLSEGLLELTTCGCNGDAHHVCGSLKPMTLCNCYRHMRLAIGQIECLSESFDRWTI